MKEPITLFLKYKRAATKRGLQAITTPDHSKIRTKLLPSLQRIKHKFIFTIILLMIATILTSSNYQCSHTTFLQQV